MATRAVCRYTCFKTIVRRYLIRTYRKEAILLASFKKDDAHEPTLQSAKITLGIFHENEEDDVSHLVNNFTSPALAKALRDRETSLHTAANLLANEKYEELRHLLNPFHKSNNSLHRHAKRHTINLVEKPGLTRSELIILQQHLHRMPRQISRIASKRASVVIPLCNVNGVASVLFQRRSNKVRTHKQQVCFPGGMVEEGIDATIIQTSLREFEEELGVPQENVEVLGILRCDWSEVASMTGIAVTPVVGFLGEFNDLHMTPNPDEVEALFTVSLLELLDDSKWEVRDFSTPVFNGGPQVIWGLTAYLLHRFLKDILHQCSVSHI